MPLHEDMTASSIQSTSSLAKHLGLSRATVSRVLNEHEGVNEKTRRRVLQAMKEVGFSPNLFARALKGANTGTIGICITHIDNSIMARKLATFQRLLRNEGYRVLVEFSDHSQELEQQIIGQFHSFRVDGMFFIDLVSEQSLQLIEKHPMPCVVVDAPRPVDVPNVQLDRGLAVEMLIAHLWDLGHRHFGFLEMSEWRRDHVKAALAKRKLNIDRDVMIFTTTTGIRDGGGMFEGRICADLALDARPRPTALIAMNDMVAAGAVFQLRDRGLSVPEDISVVGFDNLELSEQIRPRLTTIDQQVSTTIKTALKLLQQRIHPATTPDIPDVAETTTQWIAPRFIGRESSGPVPKA